MTKPSLQSIHRLLEITLEGFQGLEQVAAQSEASAQDVSRAMVPLNFEFELHLEDLRRIQETYPKQQWNSDSKVISLAKPESED